MLKTRSVNATHREIHACIIMSQNKSSDEYADTTQQESMDDKQENMDDNASQDDAHTNLSTDTNAPPNISLLPYKKPH